MAVPRKVYSLILLVTVLLGGGQLSAEDVYLEPTAFIEQSFEGEPEAKVLWLTRELKESMAQILGRGYKGMRIRYWKEGDRTAWILEEIGKVELITAGFVVEDGILEGMDVLVYRESHGWEVRFPFFTKQFQGLTIKENTQLDQRIDGISGATLSVNALVRLSRLALFLHGKAME